MSQSAIEDEVRTELEESLARLGRVSGPERRRLQARVSELRALLADVEQGIATPRVLAFASARRLRSWLRLGLPE